MTDVRADAVVVGAGFAGSLMALILDRIGLRPVLVERGTHPRFAIGESSTPLADLILAALAARYNLPGIAPLAEYGTWQRSLPDLCCGLKRGFSYFAHRPGQAFAPRADHGNELLVAASAGNDDADAHWYRPDFDAFLVRQVTAAGIPYFDATTLALDNSAPPWRLTGERRGEKLTLSADLIIDASGEAMFVARQLRLASAVDRMRTNSRAVFGHFTGVTPWREILTAAGGSAGGHPFSCDDAALHHILDRGWMWVLRFNNGVTSAGFQLDGAGHPVDESITPEEEWSALLARYPSVAAQFANARLTDLCGRVRRTGRLQRRAAECAGPGWVMLPYSAYGLDALHSTGNAHTLSAMERLAQILEGPPSASARDQALTRYAQTLEAEIDLLDQIVAGCYRAFADFELLAAFSMWYFVAATYSEDRRRRGEAAPGEAFLLASDRPFRDALERSHNRLLSLTESQSITRQAVRDFADGLASDLAPWNIAGLCDRKRRNMYPFPGAGGRLESTPPAGSNVDEGDRHIFPGTL